MSIETFGGAKTEIQSETQRLREVIKSDPTRQQKLLTSCQPEEQRQKQADAVKLTQLEKEFATADFKVAPEQQANKMLATLPISPLGKAQAFESLSVKLGIFFGPKLKAIFTRLGKALRNETGSVSKIGETAETAANKWSTTAFEKPITFDGKLAKVWDFIDSAVDRMSQAELENPVLRKMFEEKLVKNLRAVGQNEAAAALEKLGVADYRVLQVISQKAPTPEIISKIYSPNFSFTKNSTERISILRQLNLPEGAIREDVAEACRNLIEKMQPPSKFEGAALSVQTNTKLWRQYLRAIQKKLHTF